MQEDRPTQCVEDDTTERRVVMLVNADLDPEETNGHNFTIIGVT